MKSAGLTPSGTAEREIQRGPYVAVAAGRCHVAKTGIPAKRPIAAAVAAKMTMTSLAHTMPLTAIHLRPWTLVKKSATKRANRRS